MNFVEELLEATREIETPQIFIRWSALSAISAILRRNVWVQKKAGIIVYPNIYVILVARSGLRKSFAPNLVKKLVLGSRATKVIPDRASVQKIISDLSNTYSFPTGEMISEATGILTYEELNSAIIHDEAAQTILTALYDSNYSSDFINATKKDGREVLKDFYLCMIAATNQTHLADFLDPKSITGGFIARTMMIRAEKKSNINSLLGESDGEDEGQLFDTKPFIDYLKEASKLRGKFKLTNEFRSVYRSWYKEYQEELEIKDNDTTGTSERLHDHIMKVCMLLAVSNNLSMTIDEGIFEAAKELCFEAAGNVRRIVEGKGKSEFSEKMRLLIDDLLSAEQNQMSRQRILSRHYGDFDSIDLDRMIETLVQGGAINIIRNAKSPIYKLNEFYVEQFNTLLRKEVKYKNA